jgi:hypothetical protein
MKKLSKYILILSITILVFLPTHKAYAFGLPFIDISDVVGVVLDYGDGAVGSILTIIGKIVNLVILMPLQGILAAVGRIGCFLIHDHPGTLSHSLLAV